MAITTRETTATGVTNKGSPLTNAEVDTNFIELQQEKIELTDLSVGAEGEASGDGSISYDNSTGVFTYTPPADISGAVTFAAQAGEALTKGDVVYVSGVSGNKPVVSKADADDASKMPAYGLVEANASLNAAVNVITFGTLYDLDTSGFSVGDTIYVSNTAGAISSTAPTGESSLIQNIGKVIRSHASAGSIKVGGAGRTNATPNLNDGNVFIGNASNQAAARALTTADIQSGTFADARIAQSNVTQHQAALSITESQISDLQSYLTAETNDLSTAVTWANVPNANITQSSVTQHQAALSITESQISDLQTYLTAETDTLDSVTDRGASTTNALTTGAITANGRLYINEGQSASYLRIGNTGDTGGYIGYGTPDAESLSLWTSGNVQAMTIDGVGFVGIGNTNPQRKLNIHESASGTGCWSQFTNAQTGTASGAGTLVGIDSSQDFRILNYENTRIRFYTNSADRMQINANGTINASSNTGSSYLMTLTNSGGSAGQGQVLQLDASGRSTGTKDIDVFNIQNLDGTIHGVRNDGQTFMQATQSSPIKAKTSNYATVFGVLPWSSSNTYLSSGAYFDNNAWVHASSDTTSCLLELAGDGVGWYASSNSSASWNQASNVQLWNAGGTWVGAIDNAAVYTDFMRIEKASGTIMELRDTDATNATNANIYLYFQKADGGNLGYIGYGSGSTNYLYLNNQQGDLYLSTISGGTIRLANNTNCSGWFTSTNLVRNYSTYGSVAIREARNGYYGLSLNNHAIFMSSGTVHGIYDGDNSDWWVRFYESAGVDLRHNSVVKLETTSAGVSISGEADFGNARIGSDPHRAGLLAIYNDTGSWAGTQTHISGWEYALMGNASGQFGLYNDNNNEWMWQATANGAVDLYYNGVLKLETTSAGVTVSGSITATSNITAYSDARLKSNIQTLDGSKVYQMRGVSFEKDGAAGSGVVAQELKEVAPELVSEDSEYLSVAYGNLVGYLIEAVKDLKAEVDELKRAAA